MDDLNRFFELFLESLGNVNHLYYSTTYSSISNLRTVLKNRGQFIGNDFERFGERIFCYELYHQMRIRIDEELEGNPTFLQGAMLQGEVKKIRISEFVSHLGLEQLSKEFIPDFLVHTPGNTDYHAFIIEVKCTPDVSKDEILSDIKKINEFLTNYRYERGIFLTANSHPGYIETILNDSKEEISKLAGKDKVHIICKESESKKAILWELGEF